MAKLLNAEGEWVDSCLCTFKIKTTSKYLFSSSGCDYYQHGALWYKLKQGE